MLFNEVIVPSMNSTNYDYIGSCIFGQLMQMPLLCLRLKISVA